MVYRHIPLTNSICIAFCYIEYFRVGHTDCPTGERIETVILVCEPIVARFQVLIVSRKANSLIIDSALAENNWLGPNHPYFQGAQMTVSSLCKWCRGRKK
jgi:hypothetical protein